MHLKSLTDEQREILEGPPTGRQHNEDFWLLNLWPHQLRVKPQMRRTFNWAKIHRYARSLAVTGQINEILVNCVLDEGFVVIAGGCRFRAANMASVRLRCKVFKNLDPHKLVIIQQDENLHDDVRADEEAIAVAENYFDRKALYPDMTMAEYCRDTGKSRYQVVNAVAFAVDLAPVVVNMVLRRWVSFTLACQDIKRIKSHQRQLDIALDVFLFKLSPKEARDRINMVVWEESGQSTMIANWGGDTWIDDQRRIHLDVETHKKMNDAIGFFQRLMILLKNDALPRTYLTPAVIAKINNIKEVIEEFEEAMDEVKLECSLGSADV